jgi:hypothetical protein
MLILSEFAGIMRIFAGKNECDAGEKRKRVKGWKKKTYLKRLDK